MPTFHDVRAGSTGHASMPEPLRLHRLPDVDVGVADHQHVRGVRPHGRASSTTRHSLVPGTRWSTSTPIRRPGPGAKSRTAPARSSTPSSISTTTPSTRRSAPHTFSTSSASCLPSTQIRDPRATRARCPVTAREPLAVRRMPLAPVQPGVRLRARGSEGDRRAVDEEAGAEAEALGAPVPVLEVHHADPAGLLDPHDGADPAGLDVLHDGARLGRRARPNVPARGRRQSPPSTSPPYLSVTAARLRDVRGGSPAFARVGPSP